MLALREHTGPEVRRSRRRLLAHHADLMEYSQTQLPQRLTPEFFHQHLQVLQLGVEMAIERWEIARRCHRETLTAIRRTRQWIDAHWILDYPPALVVDPYTQEGWGGRWV